MRDESTPFSTTGSVDAEYRFGRPMVYLAPHGQPRPYRLATSSTPNTAYRRLALAIVGLDVATLADELRLARKSATTRITSLSVATGAA